MRRWRAEYDDGIWRFYRDGMELGLYEKGDVVVDALSVAESRIAGLEGFIDRLVEAGDAMSNAQSMWVAEEDKWDALVKDWKERER